MKITSLKLEGTYEIISAPKQDDRGYFMRVYDDEILRQHGLKTVWVQENQSLSKKRGLIRGLHFQKPPYAETKLVRVVAGAIFDVFVDLRRNSKTYGQWDALELSAENWKMVYIPKGFAHGFCTLTENTLVLYKVDAFYMPEYEDGLKWDDKDLGVQWPVAKPYLSDKDASWGSFRNFISPFF
jgi:dTDP-4-dehydrorhamnose 3,5-epimerase